MHQLLPNAAPRPERNPLPLKEHRIRARITLEEIIQKTKIGRNFLEAIEAGEYRRLPGGLFSTSYIRQYAQVTGYDAELILEHYRQSETGEPRRPARGEAAAGQGFSWSRFLTLGS